MLTYVVRGMPETKGSWRPVRDRKTGATRLISDNPAEDAWATLVAWTTRAALRNVLAPNDRRYAVHLQFLLPVPPNRRRTNRRDIDKLMRSVLDALTKLIWLDDEQVEDAHLSKRTGAELGMMITIADKSVDGEFDAWIASVFDAYRVAV